VSGVKVLKPDTGHLTPRIKRMRDAGIRSQTLSYAVVGDAIARFITIGRNKYAGLAAGGDFSVHRVGLWASWAATC